MALQKTKYVIDNGLGGLMWWAVDEDWVESGPATNAEAQTKRHLERKKGKRSCKRPTTGGGAEIGNVLAVEPVSANASSTSTSSTAVSLASGSGSPVSTLASTPSSSLVSSALASAASSSAAPAPRPDPSSTSDADAEGEQDGIQLNIGRSLAQIAKEGFERYAQGLDTTWNVLGYPTSGKCLTCHEYSC